MTSGRATGSAARRWSPGGPGSSAAATGRPGPSSRKRTASSAPPCTSPRWARVSPSPAGCAFRTRSPTSRSSSTLPSKTGKSSSVSPIRRFSPGLPRSGGVSSTSPSRSTPPTSGSRLYVDGAPVGELPLRPLRHRGRLLSFGQDSPSPPPSFALDEVSVWGRPLAPAEVRRLSRLHWSLAVDKAFSRVIMLRCAQAARDSYRAFLLAADLFNPSLHESRIFAAHLPSYALAMSRN